MFGKLQTRLTRGLLLVAYVLATSTAVLFHDHSEPCDHDHGTFCSHDHGTSCAHDHSADRDHFAQAATDHEHEPSEGATSLPGHDPLADDNCAVCRFLGLCSLPIAPPPVVASGDLAVAANPAEPIHAVCPPDRTLHSRAPPRLG